jgi:hypothetical protein
MTMTDLSAAIEKLLPASAVQPVHHRMPIPAAARRHAPILQGEILLHGVVTEDPDSTGALTISAIWATFPTGSTTMFDAARAKTVNADTQTEVRMNDAEAAVTDIKQGMEIDVYGRDQGVGNPLAARLITIAKTR